MMARAPASQRFSTLAGLSAAVLFSCGVIAARAADAPAGLDPSTWELRLGAFVHDLMSPESGAADVNVEVLADPFAAARAAPWAPLAPRLHVGVTGAPGARTSLAYAGFTWTFDLTARVFAEVSFGGAVHNGRIGDIAEPGRNAMGCRAAFRESASLGYRVNARWSVMASVEHASNSGLCGQNRGLTNFGVRAGYAF